MYSARRPDVDVCGQERRDADPPDVPALCDLGRHSLPADGRTHTRLLHLSLRALRPEARHIRRGAGSSGFNVHLAHRS